eukprot:scaffold253271_cov31-Tisochrysis_lutea.AAC.3
MAWKARRGSSCVSRRGSRERSGEGGISVDGGAPKRRPALPTAAASSYSSLGLKRAQSRHSSIGCTQCVLPKRWTNVRAGVAAPAALEASATAAVGVRARRLRLTASDGLLCSEAEALRSSAAEASVSPVLFPSAAAAHIPSWTASASASSCCRCTISARCRLASSAAHGRQSSHAHRLHARYSWKMVVPQPSHSWRSPSASSPALRSARRAAAGVRMWHSARGSTTHASSSPAARISARSKVGSESAQ